MLKNMSKVVVSSYEATPLTMAILSKVGRDGKVQTVVMEEMQEFIVNTTPTKMIEHACQFYGQSLNGLQIGARYVTNITHKVPIVIHPESGMYFIPTVNPAIIDMEGFSNCVIQ